MTDLRTIAFDPELSQGAFNAVNTCLRIQPSEKVTLITDRECSEIAASLVAELEKVGAAYSPFVLEDLAPRPLVDMPAAVLEEMESSQVSIFAVHAQMNELKTRMQMTDVVNRREIRHAWNQRTDDLHPQLTTQEGEDFVRNADHVVRVFRPY